jgi:hypothetical protein
MFENEDGRVSGSIDRARVAELLAGTDDAELKAYYRDLLGESDEGKAADKAAGKDADVAESTEPSAPADPQKASMAMSKDELVALADAAGVDTEGKTKAELVQELGGDA